MNEQPRIEGFYRVPRQAVMDGPAKVYELHGLETADIVSLVCVKCRGVYPHHASDCADLYAHGYEYFQELLAAGERHLAARRSAEATIRVLQQQIVDLKADVGRRDRLAKGMR